MSALIDSVAPLSEDALAYGERITTAWQKTVAGVIEAGTALIEAKAALPHGEFERMVRQKCRFQIRTAQRLMKIAANPTLANASVRTCLPNSVTTLRELATFEPDELSHAIRNHWVKPDLTPDDAVHLHRRVRQALGHAPPRRASREPVETVEEIAGRISRMVAAGIKKKLIATPNITAAISEGHIDDYIQVMLIALEKHIEQRGEAGLRFLEQLDVEAA